MDIKTLNEDFYKKLVKGRPQILEKNRGYGIVSITINGLIYAIPLRSNLPHNYGYKTIFLKERKIWCGLDYTKALIVNLEDINPKSFKLRNPKEFEKIQRNKEKIILEFEKYVADYIKSVQAGIITSQFRFTTLQYFHNELGLLITA